MHHSGTSCLAGSLEEAGLHLGEVSTIGRYNPKGNRENSRIMALQGAVLNCSGGSWDRPPEHVNWSDAHRMERDAIIRAYADVPVWGFKDLRTVLLLAFWREALSTLVIVGTVRHPRLVAGLPLSAQQRVDGSLDRPLGKLQERMLTLYEANPFPIVRFDLGEYSYRRSLAVVTGRLGFPAPARMEFFDPILRHHETLSVDGLPDRVSRLYESLCHIAVAP
jgi:hypothetical protein